MPACFESGFFVKEPAWHGLGEVVQDAPSVEEGLRLAKADWEVETVPLFVQQDSQFNKIDCGKAVVRKDTGVVMAAVGPRWTPLQNVDAFKWFEPFVQSGEAELHTAGVLCEGRKVWVLAKLAKLANSVIAGEDEIAKFVMLSNSHDGKNAVRVGFTPIRIVCANTLALAHSANVSKLIRVCHNPKVKQNVDDIREIMSLADAEFEATAEQFRALQRKGINQADLRAYVKIVLGAGNTPDAGLKTRIKNIIDKVIGLFEAGKGAELSWGTWWGAYNAVNEYFNYDYGRNANNRMDSLWFGVNRKKNDDALTLALDMSGLGIAA